VNEFDDAVNREREHQQSEHQWLVSPVSKRDLVLHPDPADIAGVLADFRERVQRWFEVAIAYDPEGHVRVLRYPPKRSSSAKADYARKRRTLFSSKHESHPPEPAQPPSDIRYVLGVVWTVSPGGSNAQEKRIAVTKDGRVAVSWYANPDEIASELVKYIARSA
jgi:hypothetical protein